MIRFLLDTCTCVGVIRGRADSVLSRLRRRSPGTVGISSITLAELQYGAAKSRDPERNWIALLQFCAPLMIAAFDDRAAVAYGAIRVQLEHAGTPIGPLDTLIAAHAVALGAMLVTSNEGKFRRVRRLRVQNWSRSDQ